MNNDVDLANIPEFERNVLLNQFVKLPIVRAAPSQNIFTHQNITFVEKDNVIQRTDQVHSENFQVQPSGRAQNLLHCAFNESSERKILTTESPPIDETIHITTATINGERVILEDNAATKHDETIRITTATVNGERVIVGEPLENDENAGNILNIKSIAEGVDETVKMEGCDSEEADECFNDAESVEWESNNECENEDGQAEELHSDM